MPDGLALLSVILCAFLFVGGFFLMISIVAAMYQDFQMNRRGR